MDVMNSGNFDLDTINTLSNWLINWMVFNAEGAVFQLYPGDMYELMNCTWNENEMQNGMGHKDNRGDDPMNTNIVNAYKM